MELIDLKSADLKIYSVHCTVCNVHCPLYVLCTVSIRELVLLVYGVFCSLLLSLLHVSFMKLFQTGLLIMSARVVYVGPAAGQPEHGREEWSRGDHPGSALRQTAQSGIRVFRHV